MIRWLETSVGRKALMAVTGLLLVGFLFMHLAGNTFLFAQHFSDGDNPAFDDYVMGFRRMGPLLYVAEALLGALFLAHIYLGLRTNMENIRARGKKYQIRSSRGQSTVASITMLATGVTVLVFLVWHLFDFRVAHWRGNDAFEHGIENEMARATGSDAFDAAIASPFKVTIDTLGSLEGIIYILGVIALTFHIAHGFRSAAQSLGVNHPKLTPILEKASLGIALLLGLGFVSFPLFFLLGG